MRISRKLTYRFAILILMSSLIFLMYLIITPPAFVQSGAFFSGIRWTGSIADVKTPVSRSRGSLLIAVFSENELSTDMKTNYTINRGSRDLRQLLPRIFCTLTALISGLGILGYFTNHFSFRRFCRTAAFAGTIGGHAPPLMA